MCTKLKLTSNTKDLSHMQKDSKAAKSILLNLSAQLGKSNSPSFSCSAKLLKRVITV